MRLKVQAVESRLTGMVVSNDETSTFSRVGDLDGQPVWLLDRLSSKQMFLIAGRTVLIEREARITDVTLNPPQFEAERAEARGSNRIMYRDTDQGLRYLVKRGEARVISEQMTTSTKAFALGAQVDPSFDYPLPIGGLDVLDFNFLHRDMQFALLFAGVFAAGTSNGRICGEGTSTPASISSASRSDRTTRSSMRKASRPASASAACRAPRD